NRTTPVLPNPDNSCAYDTSFLIPLADPSIRRYGSRHEHAFEQDRLVVGSLTAAGSCVCA
ncbi:hypothetical protein, partial [Mesorhizobium sp.]|uniref:hypothetical protein n=1 Tax=Mesorhizobium sp. TaxID=1871066 RepID=UPI0025FD2B10